MPTTKSTSKPGATARQGTPKGKSAARPTPKAKATQPETPPKAAAKSEYVEKVKKQLDAWSADIAAFEAKIDELGEEARSQLAAIKQQYEQGKRRLEGLGPATEDKWKSLVDDAELTWKALHNSVNYFKSHFREPQRRKPSPGKAGGKTKAAARSAGATPKKPA